MGKKKKSNSKRKSNRENTYKNNSRNTVSSTRNSNQNTVRMDVDLLRKTALNLEDTQKVDTVQDFDATQKLDTMQNFNEFDGRSRLNSRSRYNKGYRSSVNGKSERRYNDNKSNTNNRTSSRSKSSSKSKSTKNAGPIISGKELKNSKKMKKKNKKGKSKAFKIIIRTFLVLFILAFLAVLIAGGVFVGIFFSDRFAITREDLLISNSNTIVYDAEGNVVLELSGKENRKIIPIEEMGDYIPNAFVAIEDERFYEHRGIDIKRTAAATLTYITHLGSSNFGGSTITQQLIKNITNEKDSVGTAGMQRKIKEMSRAYQIEQMLEKREILQLYLNLIPLGSSGGDVCGVEMASIYYFSKSAKDLTLEECAFIAGVTHSPNVYNPFKENPNTETIKGRTKRVLKKMKELGYINDEEYNTAVANVDEGLKFAKGELPNSQIKSYFISAAVDQVVKELVEEKGMSKEYARNRVFSGGLKIYTTMVPRIQQIVESEYSADTYVKPSKETPGAHAQSAMVIIEQSTGKVVGCVGGLGTDVNAIGINRINSTRQPGSSIKPIGVYGPAIEKGIINGATVYDNTYPTYFGTTWAPHNASNQKTGLCSIRDALEVSANIVACKVMSELTPDAAIDFMRELGITSLVKSSETSSGTNDSNLVTALGGITWGISPLEMAAAYAAVANGGTYIEPTFYTKVEDSAGNVIIDSTQETRRVFSEANAYVLQNLLKQPVEGSQGTARTCRIGNIDVGAKTGTTQQQKDLWLCGFTPYYTAATWYGYDQPEEINTYGGSQATWLWANVMKKVHEGFEARTFTKPGNVVYAKVCKASGKCATSACTDTYSEVFAEGTVPSQCEGHNTFKVCSESKKLANEYCTKTEEVKGIAMPEKEVHATWKTNAGKKYTVITEKCNVHNAETAKKEEEKKDKDIKVPNVVGKTEAEARKMLSGLNVTKKEISESQYENGKVAFQSIVPDSIVAKNTTIQIVVVNKKQPTNTNTKPTGNESNGGNSSGTGTAGGNSTGTGTTGGNSTGAGATGGNSTGTGTTGGNSSGTGATGGNSTGAGATGGNSTGTGTTGGSSSGTGTAGNGSAGNGTN